MKNLWNSEKPKHIAIVGVVFLALVLLADSVFSYSARTGLEYLAQKGPTSLSGMYFDMRNVLNFGKSAGSRSTTYIHDDPESQIVHTTAEIKEAVDLGSPEYKFVGTTTVPVEEISTPKSEVIQATAEELHKRPQFVVMAFDGSRSLPMWERTLGFADTMKAKGYPIHFTYFLNAVYFLDPAHYNLFQAPHQKPGVSNIGFATSKSDVLARIAEVNRAIKDGHDIGSHNAGHFEGSHWSYEEWVGQLESFDHIMLNLSTLDPDYKLNLSKEQMTGFRAPELGVNRHMYEALKKVGYTYDTSKVGSATAWPVKDQFGLWQFSLPTIVVKDMHTKKNRYTIGMDYNFYVMQTGAKDKLKKGTEAWNDSYQSVLAGYKDYFYKNYNGNHAPVYIANHFSYWNDGVYWEVMKDLATEVCVLKDVKCVSFKELEDYMNSISK
jgi:peptidoglycan/xylan/chitin deacetylase (PgdA/CDA1 family)